MKIGDKIDPLDIGYQSVDLKTLLKDAGYVVSQTSVDNFTKLPADIELKLAEIKVRQDNYITLEEHKVFLCEFCKENNSANYKKEVSTETEFLACGSCNTVVEVK